MTRLRQVFEPLAAHSSQGRAHTEQNEAQEKDRDFRAAVFSATRWHKYLLSPPTSSFLWSHTKKQQPYNITASVIVVKAMATEESKNVKMHYTNIHFWNQLIPWYNQWFSQKFTGNEDKLLKVCVYQVCICHYNNQYFSRERSTHFFSYFSDPRWCHKSCPQPVLFKSGRVSCETATDISVEHLGNWRNAYGLLNSHNGYRKSSCETKQGQGTFKINSGGVVMSPET